MAKEKREPPKGPRPAERAGGAGWNYTPPGQSPPTQGSPLNTRTTYDKSGSVRTEMPLRGVDIGPEPDFWGDLDKIARMFKAPAVPAARQAAAIRAPMATPVQQERAAAASPLYDYEPTFGSMSFPAFGAGGGVVSPYHPGQLQTPGNTPFATGFRRVRRG